MVTVLIIFMYCQGGSYIFYIVGAPANFDMNNFMTEMVPYLSTITWEDVLKPRMKALLNHVDSIGNTKTALMGYCWGGWVLSLVASDPEVFNSTIKVGVIPHPSIHLENFLFKRDVNALINAGNIPVLWMPAGKNQRGQLMVLCLHVHPKRQ